ncbi:DNA-binding FadR family transcriptional regulator [Microbacterium sp. SLBN-154]|uniref:FadR/GntR family transcriptional regulator n=1 Tax=Microbacterium sp. SLBN-154 TaxID=2768458 RepID=UPI0011516212|nr:FCD domain-containing protein [Microbacterium sp. SLBN-154]TQK20267.1 DNA-binding FadR family transcriptional regulator [Microbacterium sp. SLBN-154]
MPSPDDPPSPAPRAWQVVLEHIERDLLDDTLAPGDHLPPERDLAARLGVGRSSVREALRVLEVMGLIRTGTGSGPSSGAVIIATPRGGMSALLRLQVAAHGFPLDDVVRTRVALESAVVEDLASQGAPDTAPVRRILDAMDVAERTRDEFLTLDAQFHLGLAEASGNLVITATMAGLRSAIESYVRIGAARVADWSAMSTRLQLEHRAIVEAVEAGDPGRARDLVRAHIVGYYADARLARETSTPSERTKT